MDKNKMNISSVETYLNSVLDNKVSNNTHFGHMIEKASIPDDCQDMVLIEIPDGIVCMDPREEWRLPEKMRRRRM